jgi:hypothetical protein
VELRALPSITISENEYREMVLHLKTRLAALEAAEGAQPTAADRVLTRLVAATQKRGGFDDAKQI